VSTTAKTTKGKVFFQNSVPSVSNLRANKQFWSALSHFYERLISAKLLFGKVAPHFYREEE